MAFNYFNNNSLIGKKSSSRHIEDLDSNRNFQDAIFLKSQGFTGNQGITMYTNSVNKDMRGLTSALTIPAGYNPHTSGSALTISLSGYGGNGSRYDWVDWGGDWFDGWGNFYIFNPATNIGSAIYISTEDGSDGVFYTETQTHHSKTFQIIHGWATQGIFKLDVACTSDATFSFAVGHYGNLGADSSTQQANRTHSASWGTLHYTFTSQNNTSEFFYVHAIPKLIADNNALNPNTSGAFFDHYPNDKLAVYAGPFTHGFTFYYIKGSNNSTGANYDWVANDIAVSGSYY